MGVTIGIPHPDDWERANNEAIRSAIENTGLQPVEGDIRRNPGGIIVQVTGDKEQVTTTSTSSTSSTSTTTTTGTGTTSSTPSGADPKYLWPGKFALRNIDSITNGGWWYLGDDCWVQELDNHDLTKGQRYSGQLIGQYKGWPVIGVSIPMGAEGLPVACSCCCCCVPCTDDIWLKIGLFNLEGCGLPGGPTGAMSFLFPLRKSGSCYVGTVTQPNPGAWGDGTTTVDAKVCCDPNDARHCPVLAVTGTTTILTGDYAGTYKWCIGPIDFRNTPDGSAILNCIQTDTTHPIEGTQTPQAWSATLVTANWGKECDPNANKCQCKVIPLTGEQLVLTCMCGGLCPLTGIPNSFPAHVTCTGVGGPPECNPGEATIDKTFTLTRYPSTSAAGSPCTVPEGGTYDQPCWYGESDADAHGCRMFLLLACMPDGGMSFCFGTVADAGGDCTCMNALLTQCHFHDMTLVSDDVYCAPWGGRFRYSGNVILTVGSPP